MNPKSGPLAMDFFVGAGGASIGLQNAGWNVKYKLEWNKKAYMTLRSNFGKDATIFNDDIDTFLQELKFCKDKKIRIHPTPSELLYTQGSPPCQGVYLLLAISNVVSCQCVTYNILQANKRYTPQRSSI